MPLITLVTGVRGTMKILTTRQGWDCILLPLKEASRKNFPAFLENLGSFGNF